MTSSTQVSVERSILAACALVVFSGGDVEKATPDPIPNSVVKLLRADGTARIPVWESRSPPGYSCNGASAFALAPFSFVSRPARWPVGAW